MGKFEAKENESEKFWTCHQLGGKAKKLLEKLKEAQAGKDWGWGIR